MSSTEQVAGASDSSAAAELRARRRQRVPALVAEWAEHDVSDPGITLLELLAFAADLLGYYTDRVTDEADLGTATARVAATTGVHRAVVLERDDPVGARRLRVEVSGRAGGPVWASACLPPGVDGPQPAVGSVVWVAFEEGDPARPVWLGAAVAPAADVHL